MAQFDRMKDDGFPRTLQTPNKGDTETLKYSVWEMNLRPVQACGYSGKRGRIERNF
jgi:hypothetical protein